MPAKDIYHDSVKNALTDKAELRGRGVRLSAALTGYAAPTTTTI